jgi:hypothetical protein
MIFSFVVKEIWFRIASEETSKSGSEMKVEIDSSPIRQLNRFQKFTE